MTAPILVFGWGNLSRGDDAIGPLFVRKVQASAAFWLGVPIDVLEDYQLQIEHALDLVARQRVLFVDASLSCAAPFEVTRLVAERDIRFTTHAVSPQSLMRVYRDLYCTDPPPCTLLAIRGTRFELGEPPTALALDYLAQALVWTQSWLAEANAILPSLAAADHA